MRTHTQSPCTSRGTTLSEPRRVKETAVIAVFTAALSLFVLVFGPGPADAPAHLYRTMLVHDGALVWDNYWFGGHYPLASYSILYYLPAALIGNIPLVLGSAVLSTVLFESLARRQWGSAATWPSRAFAVLASAPLFTGLYAYSVAFVALLGCLAALQRGKRSLGIVLAAATIGTSPLAFGFLILVLAAFGLAGQLRPRPVLIIAGALALLAGAQITIMAAFPSGGWYPFHVVNLVGLLAVSTLIALTAPRSRAGRPIMAFAVLWAIGSIVLFAIHNPIGDNWSRLSAFILPVALLAASLSGWKPRWLAVLTVTAACAYNIAPYVSLTVLRADTRAQTNAFWQPALDFLEANASPSYRLEVVPTASHWESYLFPHLGHPLARGWYQQLDTATNPLLYGKKLVSSDYLHWLRRSGVKYVVLPRTRLDATARPEGALLRSRTSGLRIVVRSPTVDVFELPNASPILTGPATASILSFGHTTVTGRANASGRYLLKARYTPYYRLRPHGCVLPTPNGQTWLLLQQPGRFVLDVPRRPAWLLERALDPGDEC